MVWLTLLVAGVFALLLTALAFYVVIRLVATEELDESALGVTVSALTVSFACCYVMLLPLEVALVKEDAALAVYLAWAWPAALGLCLVFACVLVPFAMIWYESLGSVGVDDEGEPRRPTEKAVLSTLVIDFVLVAAFLLLWLAVGVVEVTDADGKVERTQAPLSAFLVALTTAAGWTLFFLFCGVGFAAVPIEGIRAFLNRPRPVTAAEFEATRTRIHLATERLLEMGRALDGEIGSGDPSRGQRRRLTAFHQEVHELEAEYKEAEAAFKLGSASVLRLYVLFLLSVLGGILSVVWVLHIILCNLAHAHAFLNDALVLLDGVLPLLGSMVYAVLAFYLVWCTVFGCLTVCNRFLAFMVFPMRRGGTMVNALLFNALLTMLASMAGLHLCSKSFGMYAQNTDIALVFDKYVERINGVAQVVHYLPYGMVCVSMASTLWLLVCPHRRRPFNDESEDEISSLL